MVKDGKCEVDKKGEGGATELDDDGEQGRGCNA